MSLRTLGHALDRLKTTNIQVNELETLLGKSILKGVPTHMEIDFYNHCNLRCVMCHQSKDHIQISKLGPDALNILIDRLPYLETVMVAGLGEPLLYKGIETFAPYLTRYACKSHLFTNGVLIDKRIDSMIHFNRISISFDGDNKKTFEELRVGSDFNRIVSNIGLLKKRCPETRLATSTVISRKNVNEILGIVKLAIDLGLNEVHLSPVDHTPSIELREEDYKIFRDQITHSYKLADQHNLLIFNNIRHDHFIENQNSVISEDDYVKITNNNKEVASETNHVAERQNAKPSRVADHTPKYIHQFSLDGELQEFERRAERLENYLITLTIEAKRNIDKLKIPSCTAPWKYAFTKSNGKARLCPYADIELGAIRDAYGNIYNTPILQKLRASFSNGDPIFSVCRNCCDDHRKFKIGSLQLYLKRFEKAMLPT
jgi:MoaA/NifB/PqqE/SkfB family radical SAM enzyme